MEYYFVKQCLLDIDIAPLDGDVEKIGDALTHNNGKFLLIEVKRKNMQIGDKALRP